MIKLYFMAKPNLIFRVHEQLLDVDITKPMLFRIGGDRRLWKKYYRRGEKIFLRPTTGF